MVRKFYVKEEGNGPVNALDNAIRKNVDRLGQIFKIFKRSKVSRL